jgi:hypothetical protein
MMDAWGLMEGEVDMPRGPCEKARGEVLGGKEGWFGDGVEGVGVLMADAESVFAGPGRIRDGLDGGGRRSSL